MPVAAGGSPAIAQAQANLADWERDVGASVPIGFGTDDDTNGIQSDRSRQATVFFQTAWNRTPPGDGMTRYALPTDGDLSDPLTAAAIAYEATRGATSPPGLSRLLVPTSSIAASAASSDEGGGAGLALLGAAAVAALLFAKGTR